MIRLFRNLSVLCFLLMNLLVFDTVILAQDVESPKYRLTENGLVKKYTEDSVRKELVVIRPEFVFKGKYEINTENGESRFSVRNSRIGLNGNVSKMISYKFLLELSSDGKFSVLDLYGKFTPAKGLSVIFGQCSIPLYNGYTISPGPLDYANRPFVGKYFEGSRDIGLNVNYVIKQQGFPIAVEAGIFNGTGINNPKWTDTKSYGGRILFGSMEKGWRVTAKAYSSKKADTLNLVYWGADLRYKGKNYKIECEVMEKYNKYNEKSLFATYIQGGYTFPLRSKILSGIEPLVRWDAMGYDFLDRGFGVNRLTGGVDLIFRTKPVTSILRFNYEHYFRRDRMAEFTSDEMDQSKATIELLIYF